MARAAFRSGGALAEQGGQPGRVLLEAGQRGLQLGGRLLGRVGHAGFEEGGRLAQAALTFFIRSASTVSAQVLSPLDTSASDWAMASTVWKSICWRPAVSAAVRVCRRSSSALPARSCRRRSATCSRIRRT